MGPLAIRDTYILRRGPPAGRDFLNIKQCARVNQPFWRENVVAVVIGFQQNVVRTATSYHLLEVLLFCDRERAYPP